MNNQVLRMIGLMCGLLGTAYLATADEPSPKSSPTQTSSTQSSSPQSSSPQTSSPQPGVDELTAEEEAFFETKIRPVLAGSCIECHGSQKASGGLRLDSSEAITKGGDSGAVIEPGKPDASLLVQAIRRVEGSSVKMPPEKPLTKEAIEDLTQWIERGARWPKSITTPIASDHRHWAFEPLAHSEPPEDPTGWAWQPIDRFIAKERTQHGLTPVATASRQALIRRAYFDLVGLPPTAEEVQAFVADDSPHAYASLIDQLLGSQRYGERWGRHWLDLVRYADTAGDNADYPIPQAYLYRDYVIDAFNNDLPYDRFLHEQLAGDILAQTAPESDYARLVIATGFVAQSKRIGTRELEDMHLIIEDTLTTLGPALMGLSIRCARCHDHKFEPLTMQDYYALYGFFASTQYPFAGAEEVRKQTKFAPLVPPPVVKQHQAVQAEKLATAKSKIEQLEKELKELSANDASSTDDASSDADSKSKQVAEETLKKLKQELAALEKADPFEGLPTAYAVGELQPVDVPIQPAGNPRSRDKDKDKDEKEVVRRGVPKILDSSSLSIPEGSSGRLQLAQWMTTKASHLTARVMVNRIWQNHFGKPLVATPSDFGLRGASPSHPELLDWLASEFIASGWSVKAMHRTIMLSKTYQLSSEPNEHNSDIDGGNSWYWRFDRRRLDAESLRDSILLLSGSLDLSRPGPHPFPEPKKWKYTAHHQFNDVCYPSDHRSVYLMVQRLHAHPYLSLFNGADPSLSTPNRDNSTVPLQALYLLNNSFMHDQAGRFGMRVAKQSSNVAQGLKLAMLQAYGREPTNDEVHRCQQFMERYEQVLAEEGVVSGDRPGQAWSALARTLLASNEFFFVD